MQDEIVKTGKWEFDEEVTNVFDEMLERSIPDYGNMRDLVFKVGSDFVKDRTSVIDIGCSNGNAVEPFVSRFKGRNKFRLYEISDPMLKSCFDRFNEFVAAHIVSIKKHDLKEGLPRTDLCSASLVLSVLTLQFTPIEYRQKIIKSIYDALIPGGAFILVEKVLGNTFEIDDLMVAKYYGIKAENAYTQEQIQSKRKSLEGVLVPITADWNKDLLKTAGFKQIDCFWRYLNFAGFIAIK